MSEAPRHPLVEGDVYGTTINLNCLLAVLDDSIGSHIQDAEGRYADVLHGQRRIIDCAMALVRHLSEQVAGSSE